MTAAPPTVLPPPGARPACAVGTSALLDAARLAALRATGLVDGPPDPVLERFSRLAARLLRVPIALVSLVDAERQFFAGAVGIEEPWAALRGTPLSHSLCRYVVEQRAPFVVPDAREHPLLAGHRAVSDLNVVAYAGVPLLSAGGHVLGSLCVLDRVPRAWSDDDLGTLADLAQGVTAELDLRAAMRALAAQERDLAARGEELGGLLDDTTELVCTTGEDGRISYVNRAWERAFGYTADEARRLRPADMVAAEHRGRYVAAGRRLLGGEPVRDYEAVLIAKDGRRMVCRGWATPLMAITPEGVRCTGTRAGYRDVTAERHAEAVRTRLAATLEASPDLVAVATTSGRLVYLNHAGRALVGLGDDANLSSMLLADLWPEAEQGRMAAQAIPAALTAGAWEGESVLVGAGGEQIPVSQVLVAHPSTRPTEPPYFVSALMRDLRDRVRSEAALREREAEVRAAAATRASEARLRALEERFRLAVDAGGVGIFDWDVAARRLACDSRCRLVFGLGDDDGVTPELLGARVHADDRDHVRRLVALALDAGGSGRLHTECRLWWPGAAVARWVEVQGQVHFAGRGARRAPARVVGTVLDVTARKSAELAIADAHATLERRVGERTADLAAASDALRVSETRFRAASEGSLDALLFLRSVRDAAGCVVDFAVVDCNARAAALVQMPREDLIGHHLCELFPEHRTSGAFERYVQAVTSGETIEAEVSTRDPRYTAQWLRVQAAPLGDGLALSTRDISERKRLESALSAERAFLAAALENLSEGIVACDAGGKLTFVNRATRELHGPSDLSAPPGEWAERYSLFEADGETPMRGADVPLARALRGEVVQEAELVVARPGGAGPRTMLASGRSFYDDAGAKLGAVVALRDVTERRAAEQLKDQLIATVSHELRTPLTAIKGALDLLVAGERDEREARLLAMALRNTERLRRLVDDLLDVERITSGAAPLSLGAVPVEALIGAACEALRPLVDAAGQRLVLERAAGAARTGRRVALAAWGDADRMTQVVTNLVGNAVKFSPAGATITVSAALAGDAEGGAAVRVCVRDDGRGIAAEMLERIFGRFEQVHASDAREKGGAGLGLAICRAIVRQHGGRIWAESAGAGTGSAFYFTLPTAEGALGKS